MNHRRNLGITLLLGLITLIALVPYVTLIEPREARQQEAVVVVSSPESTRFVQVAPVLKATTENVEKAKKSEKKKNPVKTKPVTVKPLSHAQVISMGKKLLDNGSAPFLEGHLDLPFSDYLSIVERNHGRLVIFDEYTNRVVGRFFDGRLVSDDRLDGYSARARDVTNDVPTSRRKKIYAQAGLSTGAYRLLIVLPEKMEAHFIGSLSGLLKHRKINPAEVNRVVFAYRKTASGGMSVYVSHVEKQGQRLTVGLGVQVWE